MLCGASKPGKFYIPNQLFLRKTKDDADEGRQGRGRTVEDDGTDGARVALQDAKGLGGDFR